MEKDRKDIVVIPLERKRSKYETCLGLRYGACFDLTYIVLSLWVRENSYWLTIPVKKEKKVLVAKIILCLLLKQEKTVEATTIRPHFSEWVWGSRCANREKWRLAPSVVASEDTGRALSRAEIPTGKSQDVSVSRLGTRDSRRGQQQSGHFLLRLLSPNDRWCVPFFLNSSVCAQCRPSVQDDCF